MEQPWRFHPGQGSAHLAVRPPQFPFHGGGFPPDEPGRYPAEASPFYRPVHGVPPFAEHPRMVSPLLPHQQHAMAPRSLDSWNGYSLPQREQFRHRSPPGRNFAEEVLYRQNFPKRMRVGDEVPGYSGSHQQPDSSDYLTTRMSSEDERRLILIRDHGRTQLNISFDGEPRPDGDQNSHAPRESSYEAYQDPTRTANFRGSDRFIRSEVNEMERRDRDGSNIVRLSSSHGDISQLQYGQSDASSRPSRSYGYNENLEENPDRYMVHRNQETSSRYRHSSSEDSAVNSQQYMAQSPLFITSEGSRGRLDRPQEVQQVGISEPQYPQANGYQVPYVSNSGRYNHVEHDVHKHAERKYDAHVYEHQNAPHFEHRPAFHDGSLRPLELNTHRLASQSVVPINQMHQLSMQYGSNIIAPPGGRGQSSQTLPPQPPPLPPPQHIPSPPPEPPSLLFQVPSSLPMRPAAAHSVSVPPSVGVSSSHASRGRSEAPAGLEPYLSNGQSENPSTGFASERGPFLPQALSQQHLQGSEAFPPKHALKDKRTVIDASQIFCKPHRASRPDHIVVILRGLPGSGKSYLAKALRDLEVDSGGSAPRIHCMDDYFMSEVETVEDGDVSKSSGSVKGKKQVSRKFEYCYEPEMEEAYRSSMLKAFKKTVEDRIFTFAIVDDRNLRVADFAQFWAIGKVGYEVYLVEAPYKDPTGCAARNVHGFTLDDIKGMAERWEEAPPFYLQLDVQSLFRGDDLNENNIQEVDMDMEDTPHEQGLPWRRKMKSLLGLESRQAANTGERWVTEGEDIAETRELGKSKWSEDLDEDVEETAGAIRRPNALSGLIQAYAKREKSVRWGDQAEKRGFSIGASKNRASSALIIGPGSGYNLKSNPSSAGEGGSGDAAEGSAANPSRKKSLFLDHIRAERESFRAVFDRRRQRIGGLNDADDD
ncbi:unnamed protein product [Spirodela intermedia]|uniref:Uncharacterized protein n=1 Tax=Spirodela intermedia TaxID=51605 RepID=A0A7I8J7J6_SPIIN|nr:unnamed protein product [Spirodela intermedia]CAA6666218.1 unnamed protein product [Spirodela intermedia]